MISESIAQSYLKAGLSVLPGVNENGRKGCRIQWKQFQDKLPSAEQIKTWFGHCGAEACCIICGKASGNLEVIDFDLGGYCYAEWASRINAQNDKLLQRLVVQITQSGGAHVLYRCEEIEGNQKLAMAQRDGTWQVLIETRGNGGLILCAPTPGYVMQRGSLELIPTIQPWERQLLLDCARSFNEKFESAEPPDRSMDGLRPEGLPGDDFNRRGDVAAVLRKHGWRVAGQDGPNERWRRPGKTNSWSATLRDRLFYVFSSNVAPFEPSKAYGPFAVYTLLEHGGDYHAAAMALIEQGYGQLAGIDYPPPFVSEYLANNQLADSETQQIESITDETQRPIAANSGQSVANSDEQPVPLSPELLRVPGFVGAVMDYCLDTAPYPSPVLAFAGALSLLAHLCGRKIRDEGNVRTNLYLLALANSGVGKDWPRQINTAILDRVGGIAGLIGAFASAEGIQDTLITTPSVLYQPDEVDTLLRAMAYAKDARLELVISAILQLHSSANSKYPVRKKAGAPEGPQSIDQPCLGIFGTAIPQHFYESLNDRLVTNGLMGRFLVLEAGVRSAGKLPRIIDPPHDVIETAQLWYDYQPPGGDLAGVHPVPAVVPINAAAKARKLDLIRECDSAYAGYEVDGHQIGMTFTARIMENAGKLALLYAASHSFDEPIIDIEAIDWGYRLASWSAQNLLRRCGEFIFQSEFNRLVLKIKRLLRSIPDGKMAHSQLLKRSHLSSKTFLEIIDTLVQSGEIEVEVMATKTKTARFYRLINQQ